MDVVRIADRAGINSIIENATFDDDLIVGPAVLAPLERVTIEGCQFDGTPDSIFIEVAEGRLVLGVIGMKNVTFRRCEFRNVSLLGTPQAVKQFRKGFISTPSPRPS